jgi:hypothetical protein
MQWSFSLNHFLGCCIGCLCDYTLSTYFFIVLIQIFVILMRYLSNIQGYIVKWATILFGLVVTVHRCLRHGMIKLHKKEVNFVNILC